jgi:hypothetical protein
MTHNLILAPRLGPVPSDVSDASSCQNRLESRSETPSAYAATSTQLPLPLSELLRHTRIGSDLADHVNGGFGTSELEVISRPSVENTWPPRPARLQSRVRVSIATKTGTQRRPTQPSNGPAGRPLNGTRRSTRSWACTQYRAGSLRSDRIRRSVTC